MTAMFTVSVSGKKFGSTPLMYQALRAAQMKAQREGIAVDVDATTEDGQTQSFETLHYEVASISLLSVDAAAGATPIAFTAPEK